MVVNTLEQRLKIMVMLQNVCENCVKIKETGILIDKLKREKPKAVPTPENIAAVAESVCVKRHQYQFIVVLNN